MPSERDLPDSRSEWDRQVAAKKLAGVSIHKYNQPLSSASSIKREQFLLLQIWWFYESSDKDLSTKQKDGSIFIQQDDYERAKKFLQAKPFWSDYLKSFQDPTCASSTRPFRNIGSCHRPAYTSCCVATFLIPNNRRPNFRQS
jgi:hypothetical protein